MADIIRVLAYTIRVLAYNFLTPFWVDVLPFPPLLCVVERGEGGWPLPRLLLRPPLAALPQSVEGEREAGAGGDAAGNLIQSTTFCPSLLLAAYSWDNGGKGIGSSVGISRSETDP